MSFLTVDEVLEIHQSMIEHFGGPPGVRDTGLLESALYRPTTGHYQDLFEMAAALFESLLMNHPFVDGNKRVAFFATDIFFRLNGYRFDVDAQEAHDFIVGSLDSRKCDYKALLEWIRNTVRPLG